MISDLIQPELVHCPRAPTAWCMGEDGSCDDGVTGLGGQVCHYDPWHSDSTLFMMSELYNES